MSWLMTDYLAGKLLDHLDASGYTPAATVQAKLHTSPPTAAGGGSTTGTAQTATFAAASGTSIETSAQIQWTGLTAGTQIVGISIWETSGSMLLYRSCSAVVGASGTVTIAAGALTIEAGSGAAWTEYLFEKWFDRVLRNQSFSAPTAYLGVTTDVPDPDGTYTEVSGGSYAREALSLTRTDRTLAADAVSFSPLHTGAAQDVKGVVVADASSAGNALLVAAIYGDESALSVPANDDLDWAASTLTVVA